MKKLYYLSIYSTLFIITAAVFFFPDNVSAQNPAGVSQSGLREIELNAGGGKVKVTLPDDMRAGDTISGTVSAEPAGKTEAERAKNSAELSGYVVEIAGAQQSPWEKIGNKLRAFIKFALTEGKAPAGVLKSKTGQTIANFDVPISAVSITMPPTSPPTANDFQFPTLGQQGRPLTLTGPFDGNISNTTVNINGRDVPLLAESPRSVVVEIPADATGPTKIDLKEGNVEKTGSLRSLGVNLTAPKTNLKKGETTNLTVTVSGLEGLTEPVPLRIVTTGAVNMQGGNTQNLTISPGGVMSGGKYTTARAITGQQAGAFTVVATVMADPNAEQEQAKCKCTCELNDPPIVGAGRDKIRGGTAHSFKASVKTAKCEGKNCSVSSIAYSWSVSAADSTAKYTARAGTVNAEKFTVDVTASGTLHVTVTVTVTCSDGSKCSATGSKTFDVKK